MQLGPCSSISCPCSVRPPHPSGPFTPRHLSDGPCPPTPSPSHHHTTALVSHRKNSRFCSSSFCHTSCVKLGSILACCCRMDTTSFCNRCRHKAARGQAAVRRQGGGGEEARMRRCRNKEASWQVRTRCSWIRTAGRLEELTLQRAGMIDIAPSWPPSTLQGAGHHTGRHTVQAAPVSCTAAGSAQSGFAPSGYRLG